MKKKLKDAILILDKLEDNIDLIKITLFDGKEEFTFRVEDELDKVQRKLNKIMLKRVSRLSKGIQND